MQAVGNGLGTSSEQLLRYFAHSRPAPGIPGSASNTVTDPIQSAEGGKRAWVAAHCTSCC
jgi:hypothetical protein